MIWKCKCKGLNEYGKVFDTEVLERFVNGYKLRIKENGDMAFVCKSDMVILDATELELNMPISWR